MIAKGWWTNLVLLLVVLAGIGGLWWYDRQETAEKQTEEAGRKVSDMAAATVTRLSYQGGDQILLSMEKKEGHWVMIDPPGAAVDSQGVDSLLDVLGVIYERKAAEGEVDLAAFGLDKPTAILTVTDEGGKTLTLTAGSASPAKGHRYVRLGDKGAVVMLASDKAGGLIQDAKDLRDRSLFVGVTADQVTGMEMQRPDNTIALVKGGEGKWQVTTPVADRGHAQRIGSWLDALLNARGTLFKAATPPEKPQWQVTLTAGEKVTRKVILWRDKEEILAKREGEPDVMTLPKYFAADLDKGGMEMVDLRGVEALALDRLEATWQGKSLAVEKKENNWPKPAWSSLEESLTRDAVEAMMAVGEAPTPELVLVAGEGKNTWQVKFWKEGKDFVLAPPDRSVRLRLSTLQSEALEKSLQVIFAP